MVFQAIRSCGTTSVSSATKALSAPGRDSCHENLRSSIGSTRRTWLRNFGHCVTSLHRAQVTATGALMSTVSTREEDMENNPFCDRLRLALPSTRYSATHAFPSPSPARGPFLAVRPVPGRAASHGRRRPSLVQEASSAARQTTLST